MSKRQAPDPDDWRRQGQERYLRGRKWFLRRYQPYRTGWEHDHCEYCGAKFSLVQADLHRGYVTDNDYHWVCEACFADFRDEMEWQVAVENLDWQ